MGFMIGRKGFLDYLRALAGSNTVKIVPAGGSASGVRATEKCLKIVCGSSIGYIAEGEWTKASSGKSKKMGIPTICEVRVCPANAVRPNISNTELAEALEKVLPFTDKESSRPVLECVNFEAREGKLNIVSADGFRLAVVSLDYEGEGNTLIHRDDLMSLPAALKRARRVALTFELHEDIGRTDLIIDTELIRYKLMGSSGGFPQWQKLIPQEYATVAHFDSSEALKAVRSLNAFGTDQPFSVDVYVDGTGIRFVMPDEKAEAVIAADVAGNPITVRFNGSYLMQALKACGGMVDVKLSTGTSPALFISEGYQHVLMPMVVEKDVKRDTVERPQAAEAEVHLPRFVVHCKCDRRDII
ncbi:MAG: DNA polymerase III subunit beta [Dehalococcoidia bacterium]|nr:DNA polymerase III subunit beta [Dehalococcoidia bacterium]